MDLQEFKNNLKEKSYNINDDLTEKEIHFFEKLMYDPDPFIRSRVARAGIGLEVLIHDKEPCVRVEVAKQKYGLSALIKDKDEYVQQVAKKEIQSL